MSRPFRFLFHFAALVCAISLPQAFARDDEAPELATTQFEVTTHSLAEVRDFQTVWAAALLAYRAGNFKEAADQLRKLQPSERLAQVYVTSFFAKASLAAGLRQNADSALEETLRWVRGGIWQNHLYQIRLESFDFQSTPPLIRKDFYSQALKAPLETRVKVEYLHRLLELDSSTLGEPGQTAALRQLVREASPDSRLDSTYRRFTASHARCCRGSWEIQKLLMEMEEKLGYVDNALERGKGLLGFTPSGTQKQTLELKIAALLLRKGERAKAIKRYNQFRKTYGGTPDLYLQLARAYRKGIEGKGSNESKAQQSYSRLVEEFPRDSRTADVHWMRAFDYEIEGRLGEAVETYSLLNHAFPKLGYADRATYRIGLSYYKRGDFAAALQAFQELRNLNPSSRVVPAGIFWEGKSLEAQGDSAGALKSWAEACARFPFGYYGHLARFYLQARQAWPDSLEWNRRFPSSEAGEVKSWLAVHVEGFQDSIDASGESDFLPISRLLEWRMDTLAFLTFRSQPAAFLSNPWAVYVAARQCQNAGLWSEAFRFGTLLGNLLPIEQWATAPRPVLRLLYPPAYGKFVRTWTIRDGVPSGLVFALMKQESGFESQVVSKAGARGLMQMMPVTGAQQAKREALSDFTADSLFSPEFNLRLGIGHLRDLIQFHEGNLYLTLAQYNAGPQALAEWVPRLSEGPIEETVEEIGYSETREYVKRVLANYWTYQALYN